MRGLERKNIMNYEQSLHHPWVVTRIDNNLYGFPIASVRELLTSQNTTEVPRVPAAIRGVINLRGRICHLVDTRLLF